MGRGLFISTEMWGQAGAIFNEILRDIRLPIPYVEFKEADNNKKYLIVVKNIIDSIAVIEERCTNSKRAKFDSGSMIDEVLRRLEIEKEDLEDINGVIQVMPQ